LDARSSSMVCIRPYCTPSWPWPFDPNMWRVHLCSIVYHWYKFGENVSNTLQDIVLTVFRDAHTDGRTGQKQYASGHTTLGGGIKILFSVSQWLRQWTAALATSETFQSLIGLRLSIVNNANAKAYISVVMRLIRLRHNLALYKSFAWLKACSCQQEQERPAVADKPARRLRSV